MEKIKIICTIGPVSFLKQIIKKIFKAVNNGVRINTAYGDLDQYQSTIEKVKDPSDIPIIVDIKSPEVRRYFSNGLVADDKDCL